MAHRAREIAVVAEAIDEQDPVFAESQVVTWSDVDRLAQAHGVPADRVFVDDDARSVLDAT